MTKCSGTNIEARTDLRLHEKNRYFHAGTVAHICNLKEEGHPVDEQGRPLCSCACGTKFIRGYK